VDVESRSDEPNAVAAGMAYLPLQVDAEWTAREYATRKPVAATFEQWTLTFNVSCAEDVLIARVLLHSGVLTFGRTHRSGAAREHTFGLSFHWHDFGSSDAISIGFTGGVGLSIEDRQLGLRPQDAVELVVPAHPVTGTIVPLARLAGTEEVEAQIVCVAKSDTVNIHGRWAIRSQFQESLRDEFSFLATGAVSGSADVVTRR